MAEDGRGAVAAFLVLDGESITRYEAPYDVSQVVQAFLASGVYRLAPEMCRMVVRVIAAAEYQGVLNLVRHVSAVAATMGFTLGDESAWKAADLTFPWAENMPSTEYWTQLEKAL